MKRIFFLEHEKTATVQQVGGKGVGLRDLLAAGCNVPKTVCITSDAYDSFLDFHGLREKIGLVLNRKQQQDMRWEEIWDTALRVKALFLAASIPSELENELSLLLHSAFANSLVAVRSSATDEDQVAGSFAGLHESYLNIPCDKIIDHVKKVWASLWSDRALLYRQELGLSVETSRMAVVVQEMVSSDVSGICFTHDPMGSSHMVVEAVYGLNQGLVDGQIEPDRWFVDKADGAVRQWIQPSRRTKQTTARAGVIGLEDIPESQRDRPPLTAGELLQLKEVCLRLERDFDQPLDIEWTISDGQLYLLQARPISTLASVDREDKRPWYLSLHRSYDNLVQLRDAIEHDVLPSMQSEAAEFAQINLDALDDLALAEAIEHRTQRNSYWADMYWEKCIPFAHGVRLFGEIYNELLTPADPYEFVQLLSSQKMLSTSRNKQLYELATLVNENPKLKQELEQHDGTLPTDPMFRGQLDDLLSQYGFLFPGLEEDHEQRLLVVMKVILEYTRIQPAQRNGDEARSKELELRFLKRMQQAEYPFNGEDLLDLARASYCIRDDDNVYLGKIELQAAAAVNAGRQRLVARQVTGAEHASPKEVAAILAGRQQNLDSRPRKSSTTPKKSYSRVTARQIVGQPAAKGVGQGVARVVRELEDLKNFQAGEILVVDSIDPNMTFIVPLAAAIIEKRGGMLIHGAIIAREYGIPCITGVPDATALITSGDRVTVDGYLGILTIDKKNEV